MRFFGSFGIGLVMACPASVALLTYLAIVGVGTQHEPPVPIASAAPVILVDDLLGPEPPPVQTPTRSPW